MINARPNLVIPVGGPMHYVAECTLLTNPSFKGTSGVFEYPGLKRVPAHVETAYDMRWRESPVYVEGMPAMPRIYAGPMQTDGLVSAYGSSTLVRAFPNLVHQALLPATQCFPQFRWRVEPASRKCLGPSSYTIDVYLEPLLRGPVLGPARVIGEDLEVTSRAGLRNLLSVGAFSEDDSPSAYLLESTAPQSCLPGFGLGTYTDGFVRDLAEADLWSDVVAGELTKAYQREQALVALGAEQGIRPAWRAMPEVSSPALGF